MVMSVYKAISAVQGDLAKSGISKDSTNTFDNYKFRGIDAVYKALSPLLAKHGLCVLPRILARTVDERQTKKGDPVFYVTVEAEFDFVYAEDGTKHTVKVYGEAMDRGDKATNKAMSAAYKYAAFLAFAIPTEGDNDADATTHEVAPKKFPSPVKSALEGVAVDPAKVQKVAMSLIDLHTASEQGDDVGYSAFETIEGLDNDEKLAVWDTLSTHSKTRAWIKKISAEHRATA
jgi:hypothetical protein